MANFDKEDIEKNKGFAAIMFIPVFFIIYFISGSTSPYVKHCATQGMILTACFLVVSLAAKLLNPIPVFGWIFSFIFWIADGILLLIMIVQIIRAVKGNA